MFNNCRIMVVVAHPDDEVLGCGGTLHRLKSEFSATIKVIILGEGLTSRSIQRDRDLWEKELKDHRKCIEEARTCLGYDDISILDFPDNRFDSIDLIDIVKIIEAEKRSFHPHWIFTHHGGDLNIDHRRTFEAVLTATRPVPGEEVIGVLTFETFSSTEWSFNLDSSGFRPNFFVTFSERSLEAKQKAMESYKFEAREYPHPRSVESLSIFARAVGSKIGKEFAEAFMLVRNII